MLDRGFAATTLDDVIADAGSSKGAFFHHFSSKADLAHSLVERYAAADVAALERFMAVAEAETDDPAEQVVAFVRAFEEAADQIMAGQASCLYVSFVYDRQLVEDGTTGVIVDAILAWRRRLREKIALATAARDGDLDPDDLADHVFVTFEGAFILARTTAEPTHLRRQLAMLRRLLEATLLAG